MSLTADQETAVTSEHIEYLERRLKELRKKLAGFEQQSPFGQLLEIIHRPGWTTVAEARFFEAALDSLETQIETLKRDHQNLLKAAGMVGKAQA